MKMMIEGSAFTSLTASCARSEQHVNSLAGNLNANEALIEAERLYKKYLVRTGCASDEGSNCNNCHLRCSSLRRALADKDVVRTDRTTAFFQDLAGPNLRQLNDILVTYTFFNFDLGAGNTSPNLSAFSTASASDFNA